MLSTVRGASLPDTPALGTSPGLTVLAARGADVIKAIGATNALSNAPEWDAQDLQGRRAWAAKMWLERSSNSKDTLRKVLDSGLLWLTVLPVLSEAQQQAPRANKGQGGVLEDDEFDEPDLDVSDEEDEEETVYATRHAAVTELKDPVYSSVLAETALEQVGVGLVGTREMNAEERARVEQALAGLAATGALTSYDGNPRPEAFYGAGMAVLHNLLGLLMVDVGRTVKRRKVEETSEGPVKLLPLMGGLVVHDGRDRGGRGWISSDNHNVFEGWMNLSTEPDEFTFVPYSDGGNNTLEGGDLVALATTIPVLPGQVVVYRQTLQRLDTYTSRRVVRLYGGVQLLGAKEPRMQDVFAPFADASSDKGEAWERSGVPRRAVGPGYYLYRKAHPLDARRRFLAAAGLEHLPADVTGNLNHPAAVEGPDGKRVSLLQNLSRPSSEVFKLHDSRRRDDTIEPRRPPGFEFEEVLRGRETYYVSEQRALLKQRKETNGKIKNAKNAASREDFERQRKQIQNKLDAVNKKLKAIREQLSPPVAIHFSHRPRIHL